jgi:hypothetical protein
MPWLLDIVISILFPYLLPSLPICKSECWSRKDLRYVLEKLLMFYCSVPIERTSNLLKTFANKVLGISPHYNGSLDNDIYFLADIEERCSFTKCYKWESNVYFYACVFLIENEIDIHVENDYALRYASAWGLKDSVALLLEHKANVHANANWALVLASKKGHKDTVALLLEHRANVHAKNNRALKLAIILGHEDVVSLLLEHKARVHK